MTMLLLLANFGATLLADATRGPSNGARLIGSLLLGLLLIVFLKAMSGKKGERSWISRN